MTKVWTDKDQGEGKNYPSDTDSKHSGDFDDEIAETEELTPEHEHKYMPGQLSDRTKVLICTICGDTKKA